MQRRDMISGISIVGGALALGAGGALGAVSPAPGAMLDAYRKILASTRDEDTCCWYLGTMFLRLEGRPDIPVIQAETIMVYRLDSSGAAPRIRWTEIGYFRDPATGSPATSWLNPLTGRTVPTPRSFRDGPGSYTLAAKNDGLAVTLFQTGATVEGVETTLTVDGSRLCLHQVERKIREVRENATAAEIARLPRAVTTLNLWADRAEVENPATTSAAASGSYSFETAGLPGWAGLDGMTGSTIVRGIMRKASTRDILNPPAWQMMKATYPDFFNSDGVAPHWDKLGDKLGDKSAP